MQVTREDISPCLVALEISVEPEQYAGALETARKQIARNTEIPGFRKGKAPAALVERVINPERVISVANDRVMPEAYTQALQEQDLTPWDHPEVELLESSAESGLKFKATVPLVPQVELGQYKEVSVDRPVRQVTDELIDHEIERLRTQHTRLDEKGEDGVVEDGDYVFVSIQELNDNGEPLGEPTYNAAVVGENVPDFDTRIKGMKKEETGEFTLNYPEDWQEKERAGKTVRANVTVSQLYAQVKPEVNEEFAKTVGEFDSVEALRQEIRSSAERAFNEVSDEQADMELMNKIVQSSKIDYPPQMLTHEFQHRVQEQFADLKRRNTTFEQFLAQNSVTEEEYRQRLTGRIDWDIRVSLALSAIAEEEKIDVSPEEIDEQLDRLHESENETAEELSEYLSTEQGRQSYIRRRRTNKVLEFLRSSANIKDVIQDPPQEGAAEAKEAK
ncbi:MAG: trigger factor [Armatimonadetes bacterium]|nr:trigger factor [Armatimonadota bacterium]